MKNVQNYKSKREQIEILRGQLEVERSSFITHWREIADMILPRRSRFQVTDANKGYRVNQKIIDGSGTQAAKTLRAGMMGGVTSPARPWFKLSVGDPDLSESAAVKDYLYKCGEIMLTTMARSNLYQILPPVYGDLGTFATSPLLIEEDFTGKVGRCSSFPVGSYMIAKNDEGVVDTFIYDYRMTVDQLLRKFGEKDSSGHIKNWENFSNSVKSAWDAGLTQQWVDVTYVAMPNENYTGSSPWSWDKKFITCYYERGSGGMAQSGMKNPTIGGYNGSNEREKMLRESGVDYFPVLCPRWETTAEDVYGTDCPGMTALGDIKQLQLGERRSLEAIDKKVRPPMIAPTSMRGRDHAPLPGSTLYTDTREGQQGYRPAFQLDFSIMELEQKQQAVRERINKAYYADLFLMLSNLEQRDRTAYEISERKEEKLLVLGPVLEQLNQDLLDPLIDIWFYFCSKQRILPPPPPELEGMDLKVEYVSVMAQAQKLVGIATMDRFVQTVGMIAGYDQRALRKIKSDQLVDVYGDILSVNPSVIRSDEEVAAMDEAEAAQQREQQQMMMLQQGAQTAKELAQTPTSGDNALNELMARAQAGQ